MSGAPGRLSIIGTPIGNLEDISRRAVRVLSESDVIYCEDTRRTRKLLSALGIPAPRLVRLDRHNEMEMAERVAAAVLSGTRASVVTDAGMPAVADPGALLVRAVASAGVEPDVVPGPSAVSAALAVSGLPASSYLFAGFLPRKGQDRSRALRCLAGSGLTAVVYEAPGRVARTVEDLTAACGEDRPFAAARELTKLHQEVWRGSLGRAREWLAGKEGEPRGEWVLVVGPGSTPAPRDAEDLAASVRELLAAKLAAGQDRRRAVAEVVTETGAPKRVVYDAAVDLKRAANRAGAG